MAKPPRRRPRRRRKAAPPTKRQDDLLIEALSPEGLGVAGKLDVPFALPGDRVDVAVTGKLARPLDLRPGPTGRATPPCRHFGLPGDGCGGCLLQHIPEAEQVALKTTAFRSALETVTGPLPNFPFHRSPPQTRRRAVFHFLKTKKGWRAGFHAWRSHSIVPLIECPVTHPDIIVMLKPLGGLLGMIAEPNAQGLSAHITLTDQGLDIDVEGIDEAALSLDHRQAVTDFAQGAGLARLSIEGVPLYQSDNGARLTVDGVPVPLPIRSFLQATADGQAALTDFVLRSVRNASTVADLFSGIGTFALALARTANVHAVEGSEEAARALAAAARASGRALTTEHRDLERRPLTPTMLSRYDAVVLDPPRAGARAQVAALAKASVPTIVYVSCSPWSLARDIESLLPRYDVTDGLIVDQFLWSPHVEGALRLTLKEE